MRWFCLATAFLALAAAAPAPEFVVVQASADANVSPDVAWSRIGDYCIGLTRIFEMPCSYSGGDGDIGTVRSLRGGAVLEVMIARTHHSYTYAQITGSNVGLDFHGTLSVEPGVKGGARILYTAVYDQSRIAGSDARTKRRDSLQAGFNRAVMKAKEVVATRPVKRQ